MSDMKMSQEKISAFADGEITDGALDALMSPEGQQRWAEYHYISELLQATPSEVPMPVSADFQKRFAVLFDAEPALVKEPSGFGRVVAAVRPFCHQVWAVLTHPIRV